MVYVYLLECGDGSYYTGYAVDVRKRLKMHEQGKGAKYTRGRGPLLLRYVEVLLSKGDALRREREIKRLSKAQKRRLIESVCLLESQPPRMD